MTMRKQNDEEKKMQKKMIHYLEKAKENCIYVCMEEELDEMISNAKKQHDVFVFDDKED